MKFKYTYFILMKYKYTYILVY